MAGGTTNNDRPTNNRPTNNKPGINFNDLFGKNGDLPEVDITDFSRTANEGQREKDDGDDSKEVPQGDEDRSAEKKSCTWRKRRETSSLDWSRNLLMLGDFSLYSTWHRTVAYTKIFGWSDEI